MHSHLNRAQEKATKSSQAKP